jgi:hypothetical protein
MGPEMQSLLCYQLTKLYTKAFRFLLYKIRTQAYVAQ